MELERIVNMVRELDDSEVRIKGFGSLRNVWNI